MPEVSHVLREALAQKLLGIPEVLREDGTTFPSPVALFMSEDTLLSNFNACKKAFGAGFLHAMAIKSNAISECISMAVREGLGIECASMGEVMHSLRVGCPPGDVVFDSPVKTRPELEFALRKGIHINIDNMEELEVVRELYAEMNGETTAVIGVRVNPVVGGGSMAQFSTSTSTSKFGVTLLNDAIREEFIQVALKSPWMSCLHVHVGSMGCKLELMARGVAETAKLALEINRRAGHDQITVLDIGGGLPANVDSDEVTPTFEEYAAELRRVVPEIFPGSGPFKRVITEFGQGFNCKSGWIASRVEYDKDVGEGIHVPLIHAGADVMMRTCYLPDLPKYKRRVRVYDSAGNPKGGEPVLHNIGGPLCFSGDVVAEKRMLPKIERGDYVVMEDSGANTISVFSRHCSRLAPPIYGYSEVDGKINIRLYKESETIHDIMHFFGGTAFWGRGTKRPWAGNSEDNSQAKRAAVGSN